MSEDWRAGNNDVKTLLRLLKETLGGKTVARFEEVPNTCDIRMEFTDGSRLDFGASPGDPVLVFTFHIPPDQGSTEAIDIDELCDLSRDEAEGMVGKTVAKIIGREYEITLRFTDGSQVQFRGRTYEDSCLGADYYEPDEVR